MYLNEPVPCPFHVEMCPQWQKHGYCWAVPALQSRLGHNWGSMRLLCLLGGSSEDAVLLKLGNPDNTQRQVRWTLLKSTQGRSNSTKISKCVRGHKLPSELSTCTQVLLTKSHDPMKVFARADRCYQYVHPTWFSISEGFCVSLFLWRVLRRQHFGLAIHRKGGGGARERRTGCDKRCYRPTT